MEMSGDKTGAKYAPSSVTEPPPQPCSTKIPMNNRRCLCGSGRPRGNGDMVGVDGGDLHKQSQTHINVNKDDSIAKKQKRCNGLLEEFKLNLVLLLKLD
ncbi:hypothetical protein Gogos_021805 [Gossypium gossypioides]|uniref:Uncharacterized protein n=1 Tax=Gossypium gossypioides TaxID=34282 RepID=A0A7J9CXD4_GOSGO|nr:hypothetical protein [Gossypium gossypioides]